jgi:hypothetical protein
MSETVPIKKTAARARIKAVNQGLFDEHGATI